MWECPLLRLIPSLLLPGEGDLDDRWLIKFVGINEPLRGEGAGEITGSVWGVFVDFRSSLLGQSSVGTDIDDSEEDLGMYEESVDFDFLLWGWRWPLVKVVWRSCGLDREEEICLWERKSLCFEFSDLVSFT